MVKKVQKILQYSWWIPFMFAFIGYFWMNGGEQCSHLSFWEAIYASITLYFISPVVDNSNLFVMIAKFSAIVVTTTLLLSALGTIIESMSRWWIRRWRDSTTVYTDNEWGRQLASTVRHGYIHEGEVSDKVERTKDHILMYSEDVKNISYYEQNKQSFLGKRVYISLDKMDSYLLNSVDEKNVHFFNVNDLIARRYWKDNDLYQEINSNQTDKKYQIAIVGYGTMGKAVFKYGYLTNLYSLNQHIEYHIWGCDKREQEFLEELPFANHDSVYVHTETYRNDVPLIASMQRIIITNEDVITTLQDLLRENPVIHAHCYCGGNNDFTSFYRSPNIKSFGDVSSILTESSIKAERLLTLAKLVNYDYCLRYQNAEVSQGYRQQMQEEWDKLSGFKRGSSIARADYYWIEKKKIDEGASEEEIWRMEHLRWCRYHYYNRWVVGEEKDEIKRTHPLLVDFDELPEEEKRKDGIYSEKLQEEIEELLAAEKA